MNIEHMYMIMRLAELGSFSLAADACFVSQSSFSRTIQNVEKDFGAILFIREKNGVVLTPEGKIFVRHAKDVLKAYEELRTKLNSKIKKNKEYNIGLLNVCNLQTILPLLTEFIERNKHLTIAIHELDWKPLQTKMQEGFFDVVISWKETLPENMVKYKLAEDHVVLMVAKSDPLAALSGIEPIQIADICNETFVLSTPTTPTKVIDRLFTAEGFKPKFYHTASHPCSMLYMVEKGFGVGIIANSTYEYFKNDAVCKIELKQGYQFEYDACFLDVEDKRSQRMIGFFDEVLR